MNVVVIGAGLSGLTAAAILHDAGVSVQVLEADAHIGGRIRALRDQTSHRAIADLGPTWVWPKYQPVAARWLEKLGVATFDQFNEGNGVLVGYGPEPLQQPLPGQDGMRRIVGGPTALIDTLAAQIGDTNIRTDALVTDVCEDGPERMVLHLASGETITAQHVIIAAPLRVIASKMQLPWASPSLFEIMRRTPTWMSSHAKAVVLYDRPFWRDAGLSGRIASRIGPLVEVHDHSAVDNNPAALFGFVGWPAQQRKADPAGLRQAILDQLSDCFGQEAANPLDLTVQDWALNPHITTELDTSQPANHPDVGPASLRQPYLNGRVRFAVSEASERSPGLIEGALAIGENAAVDLLQKLSALD